MKRTTFVLTLFLLIGIETAAYSGTINVPADQPTIQAGIDAAVNGDTVLVSSGTYTGEGNKNLDFRGKAITVKSENGPDNCIIDGQGSGGGFDFHSSEGPNSILHGFTITNFNHSGIWINQSDPTIDNCVITRNTVIHPDLPAGAGILIHGHPTWHASPLIKNCIIRYNFGAGTGGGIGTYECSPTIQNCDISFNQAGSGGGVSVYTGNPIFTNCTIIGNTSTNQGGGVYVDHYWGGTSSYFTNSVIWDNSPNNVAYGRGDATITYCNIQGGWAGEGNIDADPLFVDSLADFHLQALSPCINTGSNDAPGLPSTDKDGLPRIVGSSVDMGAYEYQGAIVPITVSIDIMPRKHHENINLHSHGEITVAILSTSEFYASDIVDKDSLTFGRTGDEDSLAFCYYRPEDINGDRLKDLICHFYTEDTGFQCGDTEGILKGTTKDGMPIQGSDSVKILPCKKPPKK